MTSLCDVCETFREGLKTREEDAIFKETKNFFCREDADEGTKDFILHYAVAQNHKDCVQYLLDNGEDVNQISKLSGRTVLMVAAKGGFDSLLEFLLSRGADVNIKDTLNNNALLYACAEGNEACLSLLLQAGSETKIVSKFSKMTPMAEACWPGHISCVQLLLDHGVEFGLFDDVWLTFGLTMCRLQVDTARTLLDMMIKVEGALTFDLFMGVVNMNNRDLLTEILDRQVPIKHRIDVSSVSYSEALHTAVENSNDETIEVLLTHKQKLGINIDSTDGPCPRTPLQKACDQDVPRLVDILLEHGADPEKVGNSYADCHRPPIFITLRTLAYMEGGLQIFAALVKHGCNVERKLAVNLRGVAGNVEVTALEYALYGYNLYAGRMLVLGGAQNYNPTHALLRPHKRVIHKSLECSRRERDEFVSDWLQQPRSLYLLCRSAIRKAISGHAQEKIEQLPLARHVREFLQFHDLDEIAAEYKRKMSGLEICSSDEQEASCDSYSGVDSDSGDDSDGSNFFYDDISDYYNDYESSEDLYGIGWPFLVDSDSACSDYYNEY